MMRATQQSMLKNLKFEGQANEILLSQPIVLKLYCGLLWTLDASARILEEVLK